MILSILSFLFLSSAHANQAILRHGDCQVSVWEQRHWKRVQDVSLDSIYDSIQLPNLEDPESSSPVSYKTSFSMDGHPWNVSFLVLDLGSVTVRFIREDAGAKERHSIRVLLSFDRPSESALQDLTGLETHSYTRNAVYPPTKMRAGPPKIWVQCTQYWGLVDPAPTAGG